jgi:hypothetical protein
MDNENPTDPEGGKDSIVGLARFAVRAYFAGKQTALAEAMEALNSAFIGFDGINYKGQAAAAQQEERE